MTLPEQLHTSHDPVRHRLRLQFVLHSDATFGRGSGDAGLVDTEVDHDGDGLPRVAGRSLKGLLNEECANILYGLAMHLGSESPHYAAWQRSAARLFGVPGSREEDRALLRFGNARLPHPLRAAVRHERRHARRNNLPLDPERVLASLTTVRRQTAINAFGVPLTGSLRALRVILRTTLFECNLSYQPPTDVEGASTEPGRAQGNEAVYAEQMNAEMQRDLALLAACVKGWRRGGIGRNRGLGRLRATLQLAPAEASPEQAADDVTDHYFAHFVELLLSHNPTSAHPQAGGSTP